MHQHNHKHAVQISITNADEGKRKYLHSPCSQDQHKNREEQKAHQARLYCQNTISLESGFLKANNNIQYSIHIQEKPTYFQVGLLFLR